MLDALNITEAEAEGLSELAQHDLAMARDFARRAQAAEAADEANRLARSYQRAARSYRQTLALKARLRRDLAQADAASAMAAANTPRARPGGAAVARRIGELRTALLRLAWDEAERPETEEDGEAPGEAPGEAHGAADRAAGGGPEARADEPDIETFAWRHADIESLITEGCRKDSFCDEPLDDHVARISLVLGFDPGPIARWRDLADPPAAALAAEFDDFDFAEAPDRESSA